MIPPDFFKVIKDFIVDLVGTFPELKNNQDILAVYSQDAAPESYQRIFDTVLQSFPQHMMDIIQENEKLFEAPCVFFPDVDFKELWKENITPKTKNIIWKYLKLILFIVLGHLNIDKNFTKMLQEMDLQKTVEEIKDAFGDNAPDLQSHMDGIMNGKLGALAKEIAQETIGEVGEEEALKSMMKDPSKLMTLMHSVGEKLDKRIKSGDVKESELIAEATDMFAKLKDMPGMKQFESMFGKMNMGATQSKMSENLKKAKTRERLQEKLKARQSSASAPHPPVAPVAPTPNVQTVEAPVKKKNKNKKNKHVLDA